MTLHVAAFDGTWQSVHTEELTSTDSGHIRTTVTALPESHSIAIQLVRDGSGSRIVHARLPAPPNRNVRVEIVTGSCSHQEHGDFPSLTHALNRGPADLYLGLGDTVYQDGARNRDQFRERWSSNLAAPAYRQTFESTFTAFTWDDHEVANNFDPDETELIAMGRETMREMLPLRLDDSHPDRLWRSLRFGRTVELFIMDQRGERNPDAGEFISPEQFEWLVQGITESSAVWKVIAASVPISHIPGPLEVELAANDSWRGQDVAAQREAFLQAIDGIPGVVVIAGDHHMPVVSRVQADGPGSQIWEAFTGPLGSFRAPAYLLVPESDQVLWRAMQWTATRVHFNASGFMELLFVGEADETFLHATFDDRGRLFGVTTEPDPMEP